MEHALDRLAVSKAISRYVRNGFQVDVLSALNAGANSKSIGDVLDVPIEQLRSEFQVGVDGQRMLCHALGEERPGSPLIGMSPAQSEAALTLSAMASDRDGRTRDRG